MLFTSLLSMFCCFHKRVDDEKKEVPRYLLTPSMIEDSRLPPKE